MYTVKTIFNNINGNIEYMPSIVEIGVTNIKNKEKKSISKLNEAQLKCYTKLFIFLKYKFGSATEFVITIKDATHSLSDRNVEEAKTLCSTNTYCT